MAHRVRRVIGASPVLLLTATPIQNSLRELWGLVQYVDPSGTLLGDKPVFEDVFCADDGRGVAAHQAEELRRRLTTVVQRTLRRQAQECLDRPFVGRRAQLFEYRMSPAERALYDDVTDYLLSPTLQAFRGNARRLLLLGFHRRMASSIPALVESLDRVASRQRGMLGEGDAGTTAAAEFARDLEEEDDIGEGGAGTTSAPMPPMPLEAEGIRDELARVEDFVRRARALPRDSKAASLMQAVRMVMDRPADRRKVVIFTESLTTQDYLRGLLLEQTELRDEDITLFRGNNDSPRARAALDAWRDANGHGARAPSASVAVRLALVDEFRQRSTVLISSEAGAKGLNLQFCDTVINYDLPWNPQRVEQRIGRCHRYGQTRDVTVINFLARDNQAQRLTFDILSTKLDLFYSEKLEETKDFYCQLLRRDGARVSKRYHAPRPRATGCWRTRGRLRPCANASPNCRRRSIRSGCPIWPSGRRFRAYPSAPRRLGWVSHAGSPPCRSPMQEPRRDATRTLRAFSHRRGKRNPSRRSLGSIASPTHEWVDLLQAFQPLPVAPPTQPARCCTPGTHAGCSTWRTPSATTRTSRT